MIGKSNFIKIILFFLIISPINSLGQTGSKFALEGDSKYSKKDYYGAIEAYSKYIELNPKDASGYFNRGKSKYKAKDYNGALIDYNQYIKFEPKDVNAYMHIPEKVYQRSGMKAYHLFRTKPYQWLLVTSLVMCAIHFNNKGLFSFSQRTT